MKRASVHDRIRPRMRVLHGDVVLLGPGKADLLEAIRRSGSIREAAATLGMSYMRAWQLVRTMNKGFREPLVAAVRGGSAGGGATLTDAGRDILSLYREMEAASLEAMSPAWRRLRRRIKP